jgi:N-acetylglucosamine-6-phosphate deacetylase
MTSALPPDCRPFDLQVNGYAGCDFAADDLPLETVRTACEALVADGVEAILATIITGPPDRMAGHLARLVGYREEDPLVRRVIAGFHVEGPFLSPLSGFVGAHDPSAILPASPAVAARLVEAGAGLVRILTLAPECDDRLATTRFLSDRGVVVSAGHTDAPLDTLRAAVEAGLSMVTHLGNGCPMRLDRHDSIIQRVLALGRMQARAGGVRPWVSFIPDGVHVPFFALGNYLEAVGFDRALVVTDAIAAARLGPGRYTLGGGPVAVDASGVARRPGSENLAGSTVTMARSCELLRGELGLSGEVVTRLVDRNPRAIVRPPSA